MKMKLLTLLLTIGLLAFGTNVNAQVEEKGVSQDQVESAANEIHAQLKSGAPADTNFCPIATKFITCTPCKSNDDLMKCVSAHTTEFCNKICISSFGISHCNVSAVTDFCKTRCCGLTPPSADVAKCLKAGGASCGK